MENGSKALLIAGAILLVVVIIGIGMAVMNNANTSVNDSMSSMSTQEIDAYNAKYAMYEGEQSGANIKSLVGILISNSNANKDEISKIPGMSLENMSSEVINTGVPEEAGNVSAYVRVLENIRTSVQTKHKYWVEMSYQSNGLVDYINISYDKSNPLELMQRD